MALDFEKMTPKKATVPMSKRTVTRASADNPWISQGWLLDNYNAGAEDDFVCDGAWETYTDKHGVERQRMTGDAATAMNMIRAASNKLGIGVRIEVIEHVGKDKQTLTGKITLKYLAKERKQIKPKEETPVAATPAV